MEHIIIGDLGFARLTSPTGFEEQRTAGYAEHPVIEGKPRLQYTGDELRELELQFHFHGAFCDPQAMWDGLVELQGKHQAVPLVQGNGIHLGWFVLNELSRTTLTTADDGTLIAFDAWVRFLEYVDQEPLATRSNAQQQNAPGLRSESGQLPGLPASRKDLPQTSGSGDYTDADPTRTVRQWK